MIKKKYNQEWLGTENFFWTDSIYITLGCIPVNSKLNTYLDKLKIKGCFPSKVMTSWIIKHTTKSEWSGSIIYNSGNE